MFGSNTVRPVFGSVALRLRFFFAGSSAAGVFCLFMLFFLSENNHHRRERRRVLAAAEFQAAFNEANFRFVVYVIVKKPCVSARRNKCNDNRSGLLRFFVTLPDPFAR